MEFSVSTLISVLKRRRWQALATFASVMGTSIVYLVFTPPVYQVTARLILDDKNASISELGRNLSQVSVGVPGGPSPIATQAELVQSQRVLAHSVNTLFHKKTDHLKKKRILKDMRRHLQVKIVTATNILELSYQDRDPELATNLLNAVLETMVEENTEAIRLEARSVREFLELKLPQQQKVAEAAEAALNKYRQISGLVAVEEQTKTLINSIATLEDQKRILSAQLQEAKARVVALEQITRIDNPDQAYAGGRIGEDQELKDLRTKLADLDVQLAKARTRLTDNNPTVISLLKEQQDLRTLYNQKVARLLPGKQTVAPANVASDQLSQNLTSQFIAAKTEHLALENKLRVVETQVFKLQNRLDRLPMQQQPLTGLTRQREEAINTLKFLQSKLEEARIAEAQLVSNIRIIERAELPSSPAKPNKKIVLVLATGFGIILAISMMLLLEVLDNTLHDTCEAEELLKLPMLGVLPDIPVTALSLQQPERFLNDVMLVEPYRQLLKKLEFRTQEKLQLIVFSSTLSEEGKSMVVSHLAAVSAMLSRRTLIIDADLRRPQQHILWDVTSEPGLTDVIDKNLALLEVVQPTGIENLSILTCGERYSHPLKFLESAKMKSLLAEATTHYDLVILDTPPVSSCADANTLSKHSDGLVMIVRPNFTPKDVLQQAVLALKSSDVSILGVAVNGITTQAKKYYRYSFDGYPPLSKPLKPSTHNEVLNNSTRH